jgi:hypothetical protein
MIHASTIGNLKRTVNRPRLVKKLLKSISPGDFHDLNACGVSRRRVRDVGYERSRSVMPIVA